MAADFYIRQFWLFCANTTVSEQRHLPQIVYSSVALSLIAIPQNGCQVRELAFPFYLSRVFAERTSLGF